MDFYLLTNGDTLVIRQGKLTDVDNFMEYIDACDIATNSQHELFKRREDQLCLITELDNTTELFLVAEVGRKIIGYLIFRVRRHPTVTHIGDTFMSVNKNYKDLGIHKLLVNKLVYWAKTTGVIRKINLKIPLNNKEGLSFYKKMGFTPEGLLRREFYTDGIFKDAVTLGICVEPLPNYCYEMVRDSY